MRFGVIHERFSAPEFPSWENSSVQLPSDGRNCIQIDPKPLRNPPGGRARLHDPADWDTKTSEDCLFLDLYVPKRVIEEQGDLPAPVVVWIYGGAFAYGAKNQVGPLYTGQSILRTSNYTTIFVTGNYRVGAYGWLAGDYMQKVGQPNAGLYDQALLFEWVQKYIGQVNGDNKQVSAFGESAGASSILHHLIREGGTRDPTFRKFAVQSPAFEWAWDNSPHGRLDEVYKNFSCLAGCGHSFDIDCLRASKNLSEANQALFDNVTQTGLFPVGPAVDGDWVQTIPTVSFSEGAYIFLCLPTRGRKLTSRIGHFWKEVDSTIISHCLNETASFIPKCVTSNDTFNEFLAIFLPGKNLEHVRQEITQQYDCEKDFGGDYRACIAEVIRDASFTCNTRDLFNAYPDKSHMMRYGFPISKKAYHASDLLALFSNTHAEVVQLLNSTLYADELINTNVSTAFQTYFASFALSGDPNSLPLPPVTYGHAPEWPVADGTGDNLTNVLQVKAWIPFLHPKPFTLDTPDDQNSNTTCNFWTNIAKEILSSQNLGERVFINNEL